MNHEDVEEKGLTALRMAYGRQAVLLKNNTIGNLCIKGHGTDRALVGDWESEEEIINYFKIERFPIRIHAEEHGIIDITEDPKYLAVLDGFDGSSGLAANPLIRGGTMLAIADNLNPLYDDFIFSGVTVYPARKRATMIIYALKKQGAFKLIEENAAIRKEKIIRIEEKVLNKNTIMYVHDKDYFESSTKEKISVGIDIMSDLVKKTFSDTLKDRLELRGFVSGVPSTLEIVLGRADFFASIIGYGAYEPPTEYRLIKEIGGAMFAFYGKEWQVLDNKKWLEFGRPISPTLLASSPKLGEDLLRLLNQ